MRTNPTTKTALKAGTLLLVLAAAALVLPNRQSSAGSSYPRWTVHGFDCNQPYGGSSNQRCMEWTGDEAATAQRYCCEDMILDGDVYSPLCGRLQDPNHSHP